MSDQGLSIFDDDEPTPSEETPVTTKAADDEPTQVMPAVGNAPTPKPQAGQPAAGSPAAQPPRPE
ncbi:hypothetical protein E7Z54_01940, partial [Nocardioides sp.]